eukprot:gene30689-40839_t
MGDRRPHPAGPVTAAAATSQQLERADTAARDGPLGGPAAHPRRQHRPAAAAGDAPPRHAAAQCLGAAASACAWDCPRTGGSVVGFEAATAGWESAFAFDPATGKWATAAQQRLSIPPPKAE